MSYFKFDVRCFEDDISCNLCLISNLMCFVSRMICVVTNIYVFFSMLHTKSEGAHKKTTEDRQANCYLLFDSLSARAQCFN
jgi:hypothetical protein